MDQVILELAFKKFRDLSRRFDGFINVMLDDWRGYRFIYDVEQPSCCLYGCRNCPLFRLLEKEKDGLFTARLLPASREDKRLFGPQCFLNCKSFEQYQNCYVNFLRNKCSTRGEIANELDLINNMRCVFSKNHTLKDQERSFKQGIIDRIMMCSDVKKRRIITEYLAVHPEFFTTS